MTRGASQARLASPTLPASGEGAAARAQASPGTRFTNRDVLGNIDGVLHHVTEALQAPAAI